MFLFLFPFFKYPYYAFRLQSATSEKLLIPPAMQELYKERIAEIDLCLQNHDLNRSGQRLIDLVYDFGFDPSFQKKALILRKMYNEGKVLGKVANNNDALQKEYSFFLDDVKKTAPDMPSIRSPRAIAKITGIGKSFRSRLHNFHFRPVSLNLIEGKIIGLVGENGNGKTTLLRMIAGDLSPDVGDIEYYIDNAPVKDWQKIKKKVAFIPQRLERWFGNATERLSFEAAIKGYQGHLNQEKVEFIIHRMGLTNFRELSWTELSSGYKLRLEIAAALVWDPSILILDEPLANLDMQAQELLLQDLRNLANSLRNPVSIILSSQQLHEVETISDQIIFLKNGEAVFNGNLSQLVEMETSQTFEISGNFQYNDLHQLLIKWEDIKIEQSASAFTISCSENHSKEELLRLMIDNRFDINYFRNITGSTKKLFSDKY